MAFTSPELVRAHLGEVRLGSASVTDVSVVLSGTEPSLLPHAHLVPGSVVVKARRSVCPVREAKTLGASWVSLSHSRLVPGSLLVAADTSLGTLYTENLDYIVDHGGGRLRRIDGGSISNGQTVFVWYDHFHVYIVGDDYTVDEEDGKLTRRATGAIADGQTVLADYSIALGTVPVGAVEQAISESGEAVLELIDPAHVDQPAPGLVIGATHWAVAAVCRMRAAAAQADAASRAAAQTWLELAGQYERSGQERLARYAAPVPTRRNLRRS